MQDIDWDAAYRKNDLPWDKGSGAPPLLEFLETERIAGRVFVPGCGLGHDVRALAAGGAEVVGLDISETAIARAREHIAVGGERFLHGSLFDLPEELRGVFDWVVEHTCLSGLAPSMRGDYFEGVHAALRPGGRYLAVFYINPWDEGETPTPPPFGISVDEIDAMIAGRFELEREWRPTRQFAGREGRELMRLMRRCGGRV